MKVQRSRLRHPELQVGEFIARRSLCSVNVLKAAVDFIGGGEDDGNLAPGESHRLEHIKCAESVNLEVRPWVFDGGRHRDLRREIENLIRFLDSTANSGEVTNVGVNEFEFTSRLGGLEPC